MRKIFVKNLIFLQGLNLIIKPVWLLVIDRIVQNSLGPAYGEYFIILNLALIFNIILDVGIQNYNNTRVAGDPTFFRNNFSSLLITKILLSVFYFLLILGIGYARHMHMNLLLIIGLNQVVTSFILYFRSNISGLQKFTIDSMLSISDKTFAIIYCLILFYLKKIDIMSFATAQLTGSLTTLLIALALNLKFFGSLQEQSALAKISIPGILKQSIPYALLFALMGFYTRADVMMMDWLLPRQEAVFHSSIYAQSFRLLDAACMFAMLFSGLLLPMFSRLLAEKQDVRPLTELAVKLLLIISIATALAAVFFKYRIVDTLYHFSDVDESTLSGNVFGNIMCCFVPMCLIYTFGTLLTAKGDIRSMNIFALIALTVNIGLNLVLIPQYQSYGASFSSLITQTLFAGLCTARCFYLFDFKIHKKTVIQFTVFTVSLFGLYFLINGLASIWLIFALFLAGTLLLVLALQIFDIKKMLRIVVKSRQ